MSIRIELPTPPSVNCIWRVGAGGRVYIDAKYAAWKRSAGWELAAQRPGKLPAGQPIAVTVRVGKSRKDVDNLNKALLDLLQAHGVINNDKNVSDLRIVRDDTIKPGRVLVEARTIKKASAA
jgi:Holliday junction resolvase RusA-like endonuclease